MRSSRVVLSIVLLLPVTATCAVGPGDPMAGGALEPSTPAATPAQTSGPVFADAAPPVAPGAPSVSRPAPRALTITGAGDVLVHRAVMTAAQEHAHRGGFDWVFAALRDALPASDLAVVNLETPLTDAFVPVRSGTPPTLGAPPAVAGALASAGFDVLNVANNHSYDQTAEGLAATIEAVRSADLLPVGGGLDLEAAHTAAFIEHAGVRVAFLGLTEFVNGCAGGRPALAVVADVDEHPLVVAALDHARAHADVVVVAIHWSYDFQRTPSQRQRRLARHLVDAGADIIFGSGPHVLQEVEVLPSPRGDAVVAYSLGNLVSNQGMRHRLGRETPRDHFPMLDPAARDGALLRVHVDASTPDRVALEGIEAVPLFTDNNFWARESGATEETRIRAMPLFAAAPEVVAERLPAIRDALGPSVSLRR